MIRHPSNSSGVLFLAAYLAATQAFVANPTIYPILQLGLYALIALVFIKLILDKKLKLAHPLINVILAIILINTILRSTASIFTNTNLLSRDPLIAPLLLIVLGYSTQHLVDPRRIARVFAFFTLISVWIVIITYGGLTAEGTYFIAQKNQLGAVVAAAFALLFWDLISSLGNFRTMTALGRTITIVFLMLLFAALLILRNRSSLVALLLLLLFSSGKLLFSRIITHKVKVSILASLCISFIIFGRGLLTLVEDALFEGYDTSDPNNLSANRLDVLFESITFLKSNLLTGELTESSKLFDPHNFILYNLTKYGLFLSAGLLLVYFYFLIRLVKEWVALDVAQISPWAYMLLIAMFTSLLEYAQPFGPGTTQFLTWLFVGRSLIGREKSCPKQ